MSNTVELTDFAPAERIPIDVIRQQSAVINESGLTTQVLDSLLNFILILNEQRQIVFYTDNIRKLLCDHSADILGLRPGEALGCVHCDAHPGGCGTSVFCAECGAVKAIMSSLDGRKDIQECSLTRQKRNGEESLDLLVSATPLKIGKSHYSLVAMMDISHEKRRRALERIFFHDIINISGGLQGLADLIAEKNGGLKDAEFQYLQTGLHRLLEEIQVQKDLAAAENEELALHIVPLTSTRLVAEVVGLYFNHKVAAGKHLVMSPECRSYAFFSDRNLIERSMGNLVKNALEATREGQFVTVGCDLENGMPRFCVNNKECMPRSIQLQVFNRSFSTKGNGRGLGTYSVKLLVERYLRGKVGFTSTPDDGTTFFFSLPRNLGSQD